MKKFKITFEVTNGFFVNKIFLIGQKTKTTGMILEIAHQKQILLKLLKMILNG